MSEWNHCDAEVAGVPCLDTDADPDTLATEQVGVQMTRNWLIDKTSPSTHAIKKLRTAAKP